MDSKIQEALANYVDPDRVAKFREIELRLEALIGDTPRSHQALVETAASETRSIRFLDERLHGR